MPHHLFTDPNADLNILPKSRNHSGHKSVIIARGDTHGNVMNIIYTLIAEGICNMSASAYSKLAQIYQQPLQIQNIAEFTNIIDTELQIVQSKISLVLIGDEVADRGVLDYYTLYLLAILHRQKVDYRILLSNHSLDFLRFYETFILQNKTFEPYISLPQVLSLMNLYQLLIQDSSLKMRVRNLIEVAYLPHLKLIEYYQDNPGFCIYTHALFNIPMIKALAQKFQIKFDNESNNALATTIEKINSAFYPFALHGLTHTLYTLEDLTAIQYRPNADNLNPLAQLCWNRLEIDRPTLNHGEPVIYVHGHHTSPKEIGQKHLIDLNDPLGKGDEPYPRGCYKCFVAYDVSTLSNY